MQSEEQEIVTSANGRSYGVSNGEKRQTGPLRGRFIVPAAYPLIDGSTPKKGRPKYIRPLSAGSHRSIGGSSDRRGATRTMPTPRQQTDETHSQGSCYFCPETERLERHHIVPQRFDGPDDPENIVRVCPTCHSKLEHLYDRSFYDHLGVEKLGSEPDDCTVDGCTASTTNTVPVRDLDEEWHACSSHDTCAFPRCIQPVTGWARIYAQLDNAALVCDIHGTCAIDNCENTEVKIFPVNDSPQSLCWDHGLERCDDVGSDGEWV